MRMLLPRLRKIMLGAGLAVGLSAGTMGAYCGVVVWSGNFHTVEDGQLYRSAQLSKAGFAAAIDAHGIRSVLNLRGANPDSAWYIDELAVTSERGVAHYDVGISARRPPTEAKISEILEILRTAPKPILVHCKSGADRAGLVSALYRYAVQSKSAAEAGAELSLRYGHFPWLTSKTVAMDESLDRYLLTH
jgi:protein tyrosine/serine phosphatase